MKRLKYSLGVLLTLAATFVSCSDKMDWEVDPTLDRCFSATSLSVSTSSTEAEVAFDASMMKTKGAEKFEIQITSENLADDDAWDKSDKVQKYETEESPYTITNLIGDTEYSLRIRATSSQKTASRWVHYASDSKTTFKTKAEQIFNALSSSDIFEDHVNLSWIAGMDVTHIEIAKASDKENVTTITLTADEIAAGKYTVTNLDANTSYTATIYKDNAKRGQLQFTTPAAMPAANFKYTLPSNVTIISNDLINEIAAQAKAAAGNETNYSATLGIPAGATVEFHGTSDTDGGNTNINLPDGMSITFFGLAGGDAPTIKMQKNLDIAGSHAYVKFQNVKLVDDGAKYFINQSKSCTINEFSMEDCDVKGLETSFFRLQGSEAKAIGKLTLKNTIFTNLCSGYGFIHVDASSGAGHVDNVEIDGCTFNSICVGGKIFIFSKKTNMQDITIKNSTFYNCNGGGNYFVDFNDAKFGPETFTIENCVFGKSADEATDKNIRSKTVPSVINSYSTKDFYKVIKGVTATGKTSAELFANPDSGDFTLKAGILNEKAGDPRWYPTED